MRQEKKKTRDIEKARHDGGGKEGRREAKVRGRR